MTKLQELEKKARKSQKEALKDNTKHVHMGYHHDKLRDDVFKDKGEIEEYLELKADEMLK